MNHYSNTVVEAEKEVASLESERDRMDERIKHLQDFIVFGKRISNDHEQSTSSLPIPSPTVTRRGRRTKGTLLPGSLSDDVRQVLINSGRPLRTGEIVNRLKGIRKLNKKNPWADVSSALNRHPKLFKRVRPGVYGLRKGK